MIEYMIPVVKNMENSFGSDSSLIVAVMRQYVTKERLNIILSDVKNRDYGVIEVFRMYVYETFKFENPGMDQVAIDKALLIVNEDIVKLVKGNI